MKTFLLIEIDHADPLPADPHMSLTDVAGQRLYGWLLNKGCSAGVRAVLLQSVMDRIKGAPLEEQIL